MSRERFDALYQLVGDRVCKARQGLGMSQATLARRIGVNRVSVVNIEKGRQRSPLDLLWAVAEVLNVELVHLILQARDFAHVADGVQLEEEDLKAIRLATKGDVVAARQITDFVRRAKTRNQDNG